MELFVRSDLYEAGRDEFNGIIDGLAYYIVAEFQDGSRYASPDYYTNRGRKVVDYEGFSYYPIVDGVEEEAQLALGRYKDDADMSGGAWTTNQLTAAGWTDIDPAYGSLAYQLSEAC